MQEVYCFKSFDFAQIYVSENSPANFSITEVYFAETCIDEVCPDQMCPDEMCAAEVCTAKVCPMRFASLRNSWLESFGFA